MKYLLDTNAVISLPKDSSPKLARKVRQSPPGELGVSSIVLHELYFGAFKSQRVASHLQVLDHLAFQVIAGQAAARGLVLITRNGREFRRVEGLRWEDWETP